MPPRDRPAQRARPRLVSFEGIDGSGKSTLVAGVTAALTERGIDHVATKEETEDWLGDSVRRSIKEGKDPLATLFLFLADRAQHLTDLAEPLDEGRLVVTDRYHDSTRAYQGAVLADRFGGAAAFEGWLEEVMEGWYVQPVRTYLVDVEPTLAMERMAGRSDAAPYEKEAFLVRVRERYRAIARACPDRILMLDGTRTPDELVAAVMEDLHVQGVI